MMVRGIGAIGDNNLTRLTINNMDSNSLDTVVNLLNSQPQMRHLAHLVLHTTDFSTFSYR